MIINKMTSGADPDEIAYYEHTHLDLHFLHRYLYSSTMWKELKYFSKMYFEHAHIKTAYDYRRVMPKLLLI